MTIHETLRHLQTEFASMVLSFSLAYDEITIECAPENVTRVCQHLRDHQDFKFDTLIDLCAVDYLTYGQYDWETESTTEHGFSRAVEPFIATDGTWKKARFAVVYHLLSTVKNHRVRLKVFLTSADLSIDSVQDIWPAANWFEREAYDLYGVLFENHPDLRRILTDYGFIGHPLRKDFPVSGHVEMRYDAYQQKVIYEPVDIVPRVSVPKVIRHDNRYLNSTREHHD